MVSSSSAPFTLKLRLTFGRNRDIICFPVHSGSGFSTVGTGTRHTYGTADSMDLLITATGGNLTGLTAGELKIIVEYRDLGERFKNV